MYLSLNILVDQLRDMQCELHVELPSTRKFSHSSLLPRDYGQAREEFIYICRLSEALRAAEARPGLTYICLRDRIKDAAETEDRLDGMIVVNENLDMESLFTLIQDAFFRISEWTLSMQDCLIRERPLQDIMTLSEAVIGNTINISDSAFTLLATTTGIDTDDPISTALRQNGYHPESTLQLLGRHRRYEVWEQSRSVFVNDSYTISPYILVNKVFRFRNTYFTHAVMVCDHHPMTPGLLDLFGLLTDILTIYAERNWEGKSALSHNYDSFLSDLLSGALTQKAEIEERAQYIGLNTSGYFGLMKLTVAPGMEPSLGRLGRELSEMVLGAQVLLHDQAIVMLSHFQSETSEPRVSQAHLEQFLERHHARGGVSNRFAGLEHLREAYRQASLALKYSSQLRGKDLLPDLPGQMDVPVLCPYEDRVLHCLLGENPDGEALWRGSCYGAALRILYEYDRQHNTNNLQLLRAYLWCERKATETGALLHMHRNNVIYRIGRIEKMIGLDLGSQPARLGLELSFLMLELYGFPS